MLATVVTKTFRDRWKGVAIGGVAVALICSSSAWRYIATSTSPCTPIYPRCCGR